MLQGAEVAVQCLPGPQAIMQVSNRRRLVPSSQVEEAGCRIKKWGWAETHPQVGEDTP